MDNKTKHLEFIQAVISRMGNNSFIIKGWTITILAALFVLATKDSNKELIRLSYYPVLIFWFLDSFYLRQERLYRHLYDHVRKIKDDNLIDFSMSVNEYHNNSDTNIIKVLFSNTLWIFYISLLAIINIIKLFLI